MTAKPRAQILSEIAEHIYTNTTKDITGDEIANELVDLADSALLPEDMAVIEAHLVNTSNPHSVTKTQVGLGNADNTSDANKPVSTAQQTALDLKAPLASPALTGAPTAPTPALGDTTTKLATMEAVDAAVASGITGYKWKTPVEVIAIANITLSGEQTIDSVLTSANRVGVSSQTAPAQNGIYVSAAGAWSRATDMDAAAEFPNATFMVRSGTVLAGTQWKCNNTTNPVVDTDAIVIEQIGAGLLLDYASQAEAEAGTNNTKIVTPLRVDQYADARLASQANAETGTDNDKLATSLRVAQAIQNFDWLTTASTTARSNKDRWSDTVYVMDHDADPTGVAATFHTAYAAAFAEAQARNRSEIRLPSGILKLGGTIALTNPDGKCIRTIGAGIATRLVKSIATGNWFDIGAASPTARTLDLIFEGMRIEPVVTMTSGTVFNLRNTSGISFKGVPMKSVLNGYALGVGATVTNDAVYTDITDSPLSSTAAGTGVMISLGSGGILNVKGGGRWNGVAVAGLTVIKQVNTTQNWDGLYVYDQFFEDFDKYINVVGKGIVNMQWIGGQCDDFGTAFDSSNMPSGATCQHWQIKDVQCLFGVNPLVWANGSGDAVDCQFQGNLMANVTSYIWIAAGTYGSVVGNTFHNPGAATPLVRFGGKGIVNSNISLVTSGTAPTFGIQWDGASDSDRSAAGNEWDGAGADVTGTV